MDTGRGTPIYGLYRYVPRNRVWFSRFSVLKQGIFFDSFDTMFLVWSFDRVANLYYLILERENARLNEYFYKNLSYLFKYEQNDLQQRFNSLEQGVIFRVWALKRVSVFAFLVLKQGQDSRTFAAHPYPKFAGVPPPPGGRSSKKLEYGISKKQTKANLISQVRDLYYEGKSTVIKITDKLVAL